MCGGIAGWQGLSCGSYRPVAVVLRGPVSAGFAADDAAQIFEMSNGSGLANSRSDESISVHRVPLQEIVTGERAQQFQEAGSDNLFVEAVTHAEEVRVLPQRLQALQLMNIVTCGKTTILNVDELGELGFVLYANAALQGAVAGMQKCLTLLKNDYKFDEDPAIFAPPLERQWLVNKDFWIGLEHQYK